MPLELRLALAQEYRHTRHDASRKDLVESLRNSRRYAAVCRGSSHASNAPALGVGHTGPVHINPDNPAQLPRTSGMGSKAQSYDRCRRLRGTAGVGRGCVKNSAFFSSSRKKGFPLGPLLPRHRRAWVPRQRCPMLRIAANIPAQKSNRVFTASARTVTRSGHLNAACRRSMVGIPLSTV
jgi:hypothetical protein